MACSACDTLIDFRIGLGGSAQRSFLKCLQILQSVAHLVAQFEKQRTIRFGAPALQSCLTQPPALSQLGLGHASFGLHVSPFATDYLKEPNTRFLKRDLKIPERRYRMCLHLCQHSKGIQNYQMVFGAYKELFQGVHDFIGGSYKVPFIMATGAGFDLAWQNKPKAVEEAPLK